MIRLSDYVIKYLERKNIKHVFTVSGGGSIFLCDALYKAKKIKYISCHHEQAVAFAVEGYSRTSSNIGCGIVTTGPGGTNSLTGVAAAWIDSVPTIFISGQVFLNQTIKDTNKRQVGVQEANIISLVKPITKYSVMLKDPMKIKFHLDIAFKIAKSGRPGPVWIDIPADIQNSMIDDTKLKSIKNIKEKLPKKEILKIKRIAEKLNNSNAPLIHIGHGVRLSKNRKKLINILKKIGLPMIFTWNADDLVDYKNNLNFGKAGAFGSRYSNFIIQNCETYLSIGTRLPYMVTGYDQKNFAKKAKFKARVDIDSNELKNNQMNFNSLVNLDASNFIIQLKKYININKKKLNHWLKYCNEIKKKLPIIENQKIRKNKINSYNFINRLSSCLNNRSVIITDMGFSFTTTHQAIINKQGQQIVTNSGHAPMGWGLPAAIGAYFGNNREKKIICIAGDGGFQMNIQELSTVMANKIPLKIFVFNNKGYLTIKQTQILGFKGRIMGANEKSGLQFPNLKKIADAHKIKYIKISSEKKLNFKKILNDKNPYIVELLMDPDEEQLPKAINKRNKEGKTIPTDLEDMYPFIKEKNFNKLGFKV
tara:strand:+ start:194 stop:1969 length:1776 start_codon:yes stop_codon:yes gene_type:complete